METETETYPAMLSIDDKNYILWTGTELKIHGSGLKGKHLPIVCDLFRDALCNAVFNDEDITAVFKRFQNLTGFNLSQFQIRIYPSKLDYHTNSLYNKLLGKLAARGFRVSAGSSLEYVKAVDGYLPVVLFSHDDAIDYKYYKKRLAEIASRILSKPAKCLLQLLGSGQVGLEEF